MKTTFPSLPVILVFLGCLAPAGAQTVSEARVRELVNAAMAGTQPPATPSAPAGPTLDLTLDEALTLALEQNLDIAVERLTPETVDLSLAAVQAAYRPVLTSLFSQNSTTQLPTNQLVGGQAVVQSVGTYNFGVAQQLPWGGGNLAVGFNNRRQDSTSNFITFNPQINTTFNAAFVQPLLRGFRIDSTRQQLRVTQINRRISEVDLKSTITNTLSQVRNTYFDLIYARGAVDVARRSLELAEKLVDDNKVRVEVGALAPIDVVQAEAEAATRRQSLTQAEALLQSTQLNLKRLIVKSTDDPHWSATINPVTLPAVAETPVNIEGAVRRALNERNDLQNARSQLEINNVTRDLFSDQRKPAADVIATYGLQGIGGTRLIRAGGLGSDVTDSVPGGFRDALDLLWNRDYPTWNFQVQFSYPLGGSAADAQYARARVQVNQAQAEIRKLELQAATEVTNAGVQVRSNWRRVQAARAARELAERRLEAEQSKFEVGMSTNFFVVQAQRDLSDAQSSALRAELDYAKSIVDFERLQQTAQGSGSVTGVTGTGTSTAVPNASQRTGVTNTGGGGGQ